MPFVLAHMLCLFLCMVWTAKKIRVGEATERGYLPGKCFNMARRAMLI